jgi:phospholipid/cholesterol/gamma-HCH transport system permease protein
MISFLGLCVQNLITSVKYLLSGEMRLKNMLNQAAAISYDSLPISLIISFIAAAVIAIQVSKQFLMTGADTYIGGTITLVIIREIAPGFTALAISARAGTSISAEIANMQVTSQVDAIKTSKVNPVGYFFTPRITAGMLTVPLVVIITELIGIIGGMIVSYATIGLHPNRYINSVWLWLQTRDIYISLIKASVFGGIVALVCATQGYLTHGGAKDVGKSTTQAAIKSTIILLIADFVINILFYLNRSIL